MPRTTRNARGTSAALLLWMNIVRLGMLLFGFAACTVGAGGVPPGVDAAAPAGSNGSGSNQESGDAGAQGSGSGSQAAACTGAAYDPCTDNTQCTSGNCKAFGGAGLQVCTVACTPGDNTTCPTQNGQPATCNNMGICKPAAANACSR